MGIRPYVECRSDDGKRVIRFNTGDKIVVVARTERMALVKLASGGPGYWIDRSHIQGIPPKEPGG